MNTWDALFAGNLQAAQHGNQGAINALRAWAADHKLSGAQANQANAALRQLGITDIPLQDPNRGPDTLGDIGRTLTGGAALAAGAVTGAGIVNALGAGGAAAAGAGGSQVGRAALPGAASGVAGAVQQVGRAILPAASGVNASGNPLNTIGQIAGTLQGANQIGQANATQQAAIDIAKADYASRDPARQAAIAAIQGPRPTAPDLSSLFVNRANPFAVARAFPPTAPTPPVTRAQLPGGY